MRTFWFSGIIALAACTGGNTDSGTTYGDGDGGTITEGMAAIKVTTASFMGFSDGCDIVIDNEKAGEVGDEIEVEADRTHTVGVGAINPEGLVTHTLSPSWAGDSVWAGAEVIVPEWDVELGEGELVEQDVEFNLYPFHANDWWTCTNDKNTSLVETQIAETDGALFYLPSPGFMSLEGVTLMKEGYSNAAFTSIANAVFTSEHPDGDIHYNCYASDDEGNPVDPPEK